MSFEGGTRALRELVDELLRRARWPRDAVVAILRAEADRVESAQPDRGTEPGDR